MRKRWRFSRTRTLSARLFFWFVSAIALASISSVIMFHLLTPEPDAPAAVVSRAVQGHLEKTWDDPPARDAYLQSLRETTGLDLVLQPDPEVLPPRMRHKRTRGVVLEGSSVFIPVFRGNQLLGAVEYRGAVSQRRGSYFLIPLIVAVVTLGVGARRVAKRLSRPLEDVAQAAERFGRGELSARTQVSKKNRHFVSDEVLELGTAFDSMADRIERVVKDQRELLAAISHELRTPLTRARVALEIANDTSGEKEKARLAEIERALVSVDAILDDLLAQARAGLTDVKRTSQPIEPVIRRAVSSDDAKVTNLTISDRARASRVLVDPALFERALSNVLRNARAHAGENARIDVDVEAKNDTVAVSITDDGPGIDKELLPRVFDPFVRGDVARTPSAKSGTGLGLSLVRRIVEAHGGHVSAENVERDGKVCGAKVTLVLPMASPTPLQS
jgi:two-component system OmpR family sensor kinase